MSRFNRKLKGRMTKVERNMAAAHVRLILATREDAALTCCITQEAYAEYRRVLHPPSGVDRETLAAVERALDEGGAVLDWIGDHAVAAVRFQATQNHSVSVARRHWRM
jgi:hypothetical protein